MTREKEIRQAALQRDGDGYFDSNDGLNGFIEGAEWADKHQPSPWISVGDKLPEKYGKYYVIAGGSFDMALYKAKGKWTTAYREKIYTGSHTIVAMDEENGNEKEFEVPDFSYIHTNLTDIVTHWMPIPEL